MSYTIQLLDCGRKSYNFVAYHTAFNVLSFRCIGGQALAKITMALEYYGLDCYGEWLQNCLVSTPSVSDCIISHPCVCKGELQCLAYVDCLDILYITLQ